MKRILSFSLFALFLAAFAAPAFSADLKVGVLDLKRCVADSKKGARLAAEYKTKMEEIDKKIVKLEDEAQKIGQEAERQGALMSEATKEEKRKRFLTIRDEAGELRKSKKKISDDLSEAVLNDLQKIINKFADEAGYDLVLTTGGPWLVYAKKSIDVTDEVIRRYNQDSEGK